MIIIIENIFLKKALTKAVKRAPEKGDFS